MTQRLREAVVECATELRLAGQEVDIDIVAELIKSSSKPKFAKFQRMKDKILKNEVQTILSSGSMNDAMRKLYINGQSKNSDTMAAVTDDSSTSNPIPITSVANKQQNNSDREMISPSKTNNKRFRLVSKNDCSRDDISSEYRTKRSKRSDRGNSPQLTYNRPSKEFLPDILPDFTLDALGGVEKVVKEIRELVIRPLRCREVYQHLGVSPVSGVLLHGPPGSGKTKIALGAAGEAQVPFFKVAAPEIVSGMSGESEAMLRSLFDAAKAVAPSLIFIDEVDAICPKRENTAREMERRIVAQLGACIDDLAGSFVIVLGATNRADALDPMIRRNGRFDREIVMGIPDEPARAKILKVMTKEMKVSEGVDFDAISKITSGFVGADLEAVTKEAALICINRVFGTILPEQQTTYTEDQLYPLSISYEDFVSAVRHVQPSAKREGFATTPDVSWDDVGGLANQRKELEDQICNPIKEFELYQKLGLDVPAGILLFGPPGCGKTLLAKAVAAESGANFISIKGPELLNKYVGESEKAIRQVFQRARASAPCVIFFDELDSLCSRRGADGGSVSERVVNTLLTEMDGVQDRRNVYVVAATNRPELIDPAMLRPGRLDRMVQVPLPDATKREDILRRLGSRIRLSCDVDIKEIARRTERFSGADLAALLRQSVMLLLEDHRERWKQIKKQDTNEQQSNTGEQTAEVMSNGNVSLPEVDCDLRVESFHILKALESAKPSVTAEHEKHYQKIVNNFHLIMDNFRLGSKVIQNLDQLTAQNPHCEDPRILQKDQTQNCQLRYTIFCRCVRELGPDHVRCRYQYYRAQITCPLEMIENWDEERQRGMCKLDILPDKSLILRGLF